MDAQPLKTKSSKRSMTGNHPLLPASQPTVGHTHIPHVPAYTLITWTFGRGAIVSFSTLISPRTRPLNELLDLENLASGFVTHNICCRYGISLIGLRAALIDS